ncbi:zinc finger matrin-type protein 5 isoform X2 [Struthio camelus]|uniref:zinc finger matrin-type protein 5 isoform X2 n=1 Tax=Struthio camelus TaxID=8801 RepID=UPI003603C4AB
MGKRYFCDYCDRSFQDNLHNRKKHLNGVQHLRAKRVWYDLFRDAASILQEEQSKKPCRKFLQTGQCDFGSNCRFSHMTEQDLEKLSAQVQGEQRSKELRQEGADVPPGTIEDWLEKRAKRLSAAQNSRNLSGAKLLRPPRRRAAAFAPGPTGASRASCPSPPPPASLFAATVLFNHRVAPPPLSEAAAMISLPRSTSRFHFSFGRWDQFV